MADDNFDYGAQTYGAIPTDRDEVISARYKIPQSELDKLYDNEPHPITTDYERSLPPAVPVADYVPPAIPITTPPIPNELGFVVKSEIAQAEREGRTPFFSLTGRKLSTKRGDMLDMTTATPSGGTFTMLPSSDMGGGAIPPKGESEFGSLDWLKAQHNERIARYKWAQENIKDSWEYGRQHNISPQEVTEYINRKGYNKYTLPSFADEERIVRLMKEHKDTASMINMAGKYTPKSIKTWQKTRDISDLVPIGKTKPIDIINKKIADGTPLTGEDLKTFRLLKAKDIDNHVKLMAANELQNPDLSMEQKNAIYKRYADAYLNSMIGIATPEEDVKIEDYLPSQRKGEASESWLGRSLDAITNLLSDKEVSAKPSSIWDKETEARFQSWYKNVIKGKQGYDKDPDVAAEKGHYDLRSAFLAGASPDDKGHWPRKFAKSSHPSVPSGMETIGGE